MTASRVKLRTVTRSQGNNRALKERHVQPKLCEPEFEEMPVLTQAFRRMVRGLEFDVCEMAFTTYLCAKACGKPFTGLPIFLVRGFHHAAMTVATARPVGHPQGLEGTCVGVNRGYTVTTGVWARGILADEYGVDLGKVTWVCSGDEHVAEYRPPENVKPAPEGSDLVEMMLSGELAAVIGFSADRPKLSPLIPRPKEDGFRALEARGLYPINHLIVVSDHVLQEHPEVASDLFEAFTESKKLYVEELRAESIEDPTPTDDMYRHVMEITGSDPLPYGIEPNRPMIDKLIEHAVSQKILDEPPGVESLFADSTLDLVG